MADFDIDILKRRQSDLACLFNGRWRDEYFLHLALFDHIAEVGVLIDKWRASKCAAHDEMISKEMMDLFILLLMWRCGEDGLFEERLGKFLLHVRA